MKKFYVLTIATLVVFQVASAQRTKNRLTWAGGNGNITLATDFTAGSKWRLPNSTSTTAVGSIVAGDTLYINGASVDIQTAVSLTQANIVLDLGGVGNNATYTLGMTSGAASLTLSSTSAISIRTGGKLYAKGSGSGNVREYKIGTVVKLSNFGNNTNYTQTGPAQASSISGTATTGSPLLGFNAGVLPVVLVSFDAVKQSTGVSLTWKTQQEFNTKEFVIEKSSNGIDFTSVASVVAAGNSTVVRSYTYNDGTMVSGIVYYRVRIVDFECKSVITPVKAVRSSNSAAKV